MRGQEFYEQLSLEDGKAEDAAGCEQRRDRRKDHQNCKVSELRPLFGLQYT